MKTIFDKDYRLLPQKLDASECLPFGVVYASEKVQIVIKPHSANNNTDDIEQWKKVFKEYLVSYVLT